MKKRLNKKGFTIIELVIVVAVIAILSAVLIPTFSRVVRNAKESADTTLVRNLNTMLKTNPDGHDTMQEALDTVAEQGYDVAKIDTKAEDNKIFWDSVNDCFVYYTEDGFKYADSTMEKPADIALWQIAPEVDPESPYSTYLYKYEGNGTVNTTKGIDVGNETVENVVYTNNGEAQTVVIRTNGGNLEVNAPADTVNHYGEAAFVDIKAIAANSFHVFGKVDLVSVTNGRVVLEAQAEAKAVHAEGTGVKLDVASSAVVETITQKTAGALEVTGANKTVETKDLQTVKNENVVISIDNAAALKSFVNGTYVNGKLTASFELNEAINISRKLVLNLNGYTITNTLTKNRPFHLVAGADVTVDGTVAGSTIHTVDTANSYGVFRLEAKNTKLVINGGYYPTTTDNGAFVRVLQNVEISTYVEFNDIKVETDGGQVYDTASTKSVNNTLIVNGGTFKHGYAVDQREDSNTKGIRCPAFRTINATFEKVTVDSQFSMVVETWLGETEIKNCTFKVISQIDSIDNFANAAIGAGNGSKVTLQGGSISGKYAIVLLPTGQTVINNGATVSGRVADLLVYTMYEGKTSTVTGLNNASRANGQ